MKDIGDELLLVSGEGYRLPKREKVGGESGVLHIDLVLVEGSDWQERYLMLDWGLARRTWRYSRGRIWSRYADAGWWWTGAWRLVLQLLGVPKWPVEEVDCPGLQRQPFIDLVDLELWNPYSVDPGADGLVGLTVSAAWAKDFDQS
jgi:hypothetical protein